MVQVRGVASEVVVHIAHNRFQANVGVYAMVERIANTDQHETDAHRDDCVPMVYFIDL